MWTIFEVFTYEKFQSVIAKVKFNSALQENEMYFQQYNERCKNGKVLYWITLGHFYYKHGQTQLVHCMRGVKESVVLFNLF